MRQLLRFEHWIIQKFKFDRMTNNLLWLTVAFFPLIIALIGWLLLLHEPSNVNFIVARDTAFSGKVAEIFFKDDAWYIRPLLRPLLLNFTPINGQTPIQENDQLAIGHTIFQVKGLDGWTPHLRTVGYYATDRDLSYGVSVGRSIHPEEANHWKYNDIIVKDSTFEPVHFMIFPMASQQYRIKNVAQKGTFIPYVAPKEEKPTRKKRSEPPPEWMMINNETTLQAGQQIKIENTILELAFIKTQEALALKIVRGSRPTYQLARDAANIIGGLQMIPNEYIPDYLVDEEFLEYVRQAIEQGVLSVTDSPKQAGTLVLSVKGFSPEGKFVEKALASLSDKERLLVRKIFRFREQADAPLRWRRPFNREDEDSYAFYPERLENFDIDATTKRIKNIYEYAARLTNPHTIAEELTAERGEIFDTNQQSNARLLAYTGPQPSPVAELLLIPSEAAETILPFDTKTAAPDNLAYAAGGYQFSDGTSVIYQNEAFQHVTQNAAVALKNEDTFTAGQYTFRFIAPGNGVLAQNVKDKNNTRRYYPLGSRLAHIIGYSYARNQFKGNIEKVFDHVLLGNEKTQPWWSLKRTTERAPGNNVILTIDDDLQRVVYAELYKKLTELNTRYRSKSFTGAAVAINKEGEILASATFPSYNPNAIQDILQALNASVEDPWNSAYINRATQKSYPPGSTMKVIMSTIALDNKAQFLLDMGDGQYLINNNGSGFACSGYLSSFHGVSFERYGVPDFGGSAHGELTLDAALTKSCNNTFAFLALSAGWEMIQKYAERYGFNAEFDFLPYQMFKDDPQLVSNIRRELQDPLTSLKSQAPTPQEPLKLPQLARMGIGQWEILATPLQMATVAMTVGNHGLRPYPHLVKAIQNRADGTIRTLPYPQKEQVFPAELFNELVPMMQHVVQMGSAVRMTQSRIPYYSLKDHVAGKTGTAEVEDQRGRKSNVVWFISFAPVENPQIAIAVVIEKGPIISGEAVEVARGIWEKAVLLFPESFQTPAPQ